ncbi:hypothetical protein WN51_13101 [Melipona quadrifasciata]|uniref:Uncharacterized protein n=1 Tax=Melipona quadrifasciata TaxID=166423 RepID=A0A0M9A0I2_9HYME|nr:hypothetical protein WN51_13101 [Melipona quadrifasciata]
MYNLHILENSCFLFVEITQDECVGAESKIDSNLARRAIQAIVKDNVRILRDKQLFRYYLNGVDAFWLIQKMYHQCSVKFKNI